MNQDKITAFEATIKKDYGNMAGLVVLKNGKALYEGGFNDCTPESPVHVFSVTKSIVSLLVGIAMDRGHIQSVDQKVLDFFPDYTPKRGEKTIQQVTLRHLLTMTAPYKYRSAPYTRYFTSDDWVKAALDLLGGKSPMGTFRYTPLIGPDILTGILARASGQPVLEFAREHLFAPLGITVAGSVVFRDKEDQFAFLKTRGVSGWVADPRGVNTAGWGLTLSARDMAKMGQLVLDGGRWEGRQVVPAEWLDESTREHSRWAELDLPFGYLWWTEVASGLAAMGDSGNVIYINREKKLVVSMASLYKPTARDRVELITRVIEPLFG